MAEGRTFQATLAEAAAGAGYEVSGDRQDDKARWSVSVRRCLNHLQAAGLVQWGGIKRPNGQWRCIEVCMPTTQQQRTIMVVMSTWSGRAARN
jgi:hypothetical protein